MLTFRKATAADMLLYFEWANDEEVRQQSFQSNPISLEGHKKWFTDKISDPDCIMLLFEDDHNIPVGQIRFQKQDESGYVIGISIDKSCRGKGYAVMLLQQSSDYFLKLHPDMMIYAFIKKENIASVRSFANAGFSLNETLFTDEKSVLYTKQIKNENS